MSPAASLLAHARELAAAIAAKSPLAIAAWQAKKPARVDPLGAIAKPWACTMAVVSTRFAGLVTLRGDRRIPRGFPLHRDEVLDILMAH